MTRYLRVLDGSLSPTLVKRLAQDQHFPLPSGDLESALSVPTDCESLNDYLRCFDLPVSLLQTRESLTLAVQELSARLEAQGLLYAELRFAPSQHTRQGTRYLRVVEAAIAGLPKPKTGAGWGFSCQLILCCMRGGEEEANLETVEVARSFLGKGVCALDLAGAEALYPTSQYGELFSLAKGWGVPFTLHAGGGRRTGEHLAGFETGRQPDWPRSSGKGGPSVASGAFPPPYPAGALSHQQPPNQGCSFFGGFSPAGVSGTRLAGYPEHGQHDSFPHHLGRGVRFAGNHPPGAPSAAVKQCGGSLSSQ